MWHHLVQGAMMIGVVVGGRGGGVRMMTFCMVGSVFIEKLRWLKW